MASASARISELPKIVQLPLERLYRLTVDQYEKMTAAGILGPEDRVELLAGLIIEKVTQNPPHNATIDLVREALRVTLPPGWYAREQKAIRLAKSMPEPDVSVVRGSPHHYLNHHPRPQDIALLIEVADSTLLDDRKGKGPLYARDLIPIYWIINLVEDRIEVYTQPRAGKQPRYRERQDLGVSEFVPLIIEGSEVDQLAVSDLLPRKSSA